MPHGLSNIKIINLIFISGAPFFKFYINVIKSYEIATICESKEENIKLRNMYQPNVKQLSDVITKYITLLNIREYKTDIIYLLQIFATSEMTMVEKEYNYIMQIDY